MRSYARLLSIFALAVLTNAFPLGDRTLLARYNGASNAADRNFILRSQMTTPPACSTGKTLSSASTLSGSTAAAKRTTASASITASGWSDLCASSGIGDLSTQYLCLNMGQDGWGYALSTAADACVQQNVADEMISFAKLPGILNSDDMISYAISYRQLPRQAVSVSGVVPSTLYCTFPPVNPELSGIVNAQPTGVSPGLFGSPSVPVVPFGSDGTCPYGSSPDASTCLCTGPTVNGTSDVSNTVPLPANTTDGTNTTTTDACDTCFTNSNSTATPDLGASNSTLTGTTGNSTVAGSNSTLNGTDTTDSTLTGSDSTLNSTDTTNSTLTGSDSTLNSTESITSTDISGNTSTLTDSGLAATGISTTSTDIDSASASATNTGISTTSTNIDSASASATATLGASTEASTTSTASADASAGTSGQTFDGNIHDPAGR